MAEPFKPCSIVGCNGNAHYIAHGARGWCNLHWLRWRRHGSPTAGGDYRPAKGEIQSWIDQHATYTGDACLTWPFATNPNGYGVVKVDHLQVGAHFAMCERVHGPRPTPTHEASHSCGNGHLACVHPEHLSWKTPAQNHADKLIHGTHNRGQRHNMSKLTEVDVQAIRRMSATKSPREIAAHFGVTRQAVSLVIKRVNWGWLD